MKNEGIQVFNTYRNKFFQSALPLINSYKSLLAHKERSFLLDLCLQILAYGFGIRMQARTVFKKHTLEGKPVKEFMKQEISTYGKNVILQAIEAINQAFLSSFDNKRSDYLKELVINEELTKVRPKDKEAISIYKDFKENWLPAYELERKHIAAEIKQQLNLSDKIISRLQQIAFDEVISLVNGKFRDNTKHVVELLELAIEQYFPLFLKDLGVKNKPLTLLSLRKSAKKPFNTLCYRCGRQLLKVDNRHYCTRKDNRACYIARFKGERNSGFPMAILRTKNKCDNCKEYSSLDHVHKHNGIEMQFCTERCWEAYRKRSYRNRRQSISA